jgi:CheY-like chemotaxis protein
VHAFSAGPGRGSEFTLELPLAAEAPARPAAPVGRPDGARPLRVLIVEDNRDAAESLRMLLEASGHEASAAYAGAAAVEAARRTRPDVVLCDIGLPGGMDGYAVARALRADAGLSAATLIALTGYAQEEDQRTAREAGFDRHLTKPVEPAALLRLLEALPGRPGE